MTRKGKNADGQDTFFVQAGGGRAAALTLGFPADARAAVRLRRAGHRQRRRRFLLARAAEDRRRFRRRARRRTAGARRPIVRAARPVGHAARRGAAGGAERSPRRSGARLARRGDLPAHNRADADRAKARRTRSCGSARRPDETRKLWSALPALAASAPLGAPASGRDRPGGDDGAGRRRLSGGRGPALRAGAFDGVRGRSVVALEDDGRRRPTDRTNSSGGRRRAGSRRPRRIRWRSRVPDAPEPGDAIAIDVDARDASFAPVPDAVGRRDAHAARRRDASRSSCATPTPPAAGTRRRCGRTQPGLYRIHADARRGTSDARQRRSLDVCRRRRSRVRRPAAERRVPAPRRARRPAAVTCGRPRRRQVPSWLQAIVPQNAAPERRDLWHEPWAFALIDRCCSRRSGSCAAAGGCDEV